MVFGKKLFFFFCLTCFFLSRAGFVSALEINYPDIFGLSFNDESKLSEYICYLFGLITYLSFLITVIVIAFGGIYYLVSYGRGKFTSEGKDWIKAGISGFFIVICASLIIATINPNLSTCQFEFLPFNIFNPFGIPSLSPGVDVITFQEIPLGTLTENLLTRTMACYDFDQNGDPIKGDKIELDNIYAEDIFGPTYLYHDRVDCLAKLVEAAEKKNRIITALGDEIIKLMDKCSCEGKCDSNVEECDDPTKCPNGSCAPPSDPSCRQPDDDNTKDCCPDVCIKDGNILDIDVSKGEEEGEGKKECDESGGEIMGIKEIIEHGPIAVSIKLGDVTGSASCPAYIAVSDLTVSCYAAPKAADLHQTVDFIPNVSGGTGSYAYSWTGACTGPSEICSKSFSNRGTKTAHLTVISGKKSKSADCSVQITSDPDLTVSCYAQPGSADIGQTVNFFSNILGGVSPYAYSWTGACAGSEEDCSASFSSQGTKKASLTVTPGICPSGNECFDGQTCDPATNKCACSSDNNCPNDEICDPSTIDPSTGKCDCKTKPIIYHGLDEFRCPNPLDGIGAKVCENLLNWVDGEKISYPPFPSGPTTTVVLFGRWNNLNLIQQLIYFKEKIDYWDQDSGISVDTIELDKYRKACSCSNADQYQYYLTIPYIDLLKTYQSADKQNLVILKAPQTQFYDSAYSISMKPMSAAKYCQGFNYADSNCLKQCNDACPDASEQAIWLYQNCPKCADDAGPSCLNDQEKCIENAYNSRPCIYGEDTSQKFGECISSCQDDCINNCGEKYFECSDEYKSCKNKCENDSSCVLDNADKCLFNSQNFVNCANQLTNQGNTQITDQGNADYCINNAYLCKNGSDNYADSTSPNCSQCPCATAGPQCNEYSYNDDPLTFYLENSWWNNPNRDAINSPEPIGTDRVIELESGGEIPVGKTIDDAKNWAIKLVDNLKGDGVIKTIQDTIDLMTKIGKAETTDPVQDYCKCNAKLETGDAICKTDCEYKQEEECNPDDDSDCWWNCGCNLVPCKGNPCKQMIDWLAKLKNDYGSNTLAVDRSNIIKELEYSRKTINDCSLTGNNYGLLEARLLSCTRVEDEIIPPIKTYCYGKKLGKLDDLIYTDNWFCAKQYSKDPKLSNNPLYNK